MSNHDDSPRFNVYGQPLGGSDSVDPDAPTDPNIQIKLPIEEVQRFWPPAERTLAATYSSLIPSLDVPAHLVVMRGRHVQDPNAYQAVSISVEPEYTQRVRTLMGLGHGRPEQPAVVSYRPGYDTVYLDTSMAVGLTKFDSAEGRPRLIALAAFGVDDANRLFIKQIQAVTGTTAADGEAHVESGLYEGFLWRHTLVRLCETIAREIGASAVVVQSAANNQWEKVRDDPEKRKLYDDVARQLGYRQWEGGDRTGNWIKLRPRLFE